MAVSTVRAFTMRVVMQMLVVTVCVRLIVRVFHSYLSKSSYRRVRRLGGLRSNSNFGSPSSPYDAGTPTQSA